MFIAQAAAAEAAAGVEVAYMIPKEGALKWFDLFAIPADAPHPDNAHKFIDFMLRADIAAANTNYVYYASGNKAALEFIDDEVKNDPAIYPTPEVSAKLFNLKAHTPDYDELLTETWQRIDSAAGKQASLAGAWRIRERESQPGQMTLIQQGPRKTIKWLSDTRFQWAAINTQTKQFFGTGGGTYTLENGKYTEHIAFFSRDPKRVGMSVSFDYELKDSDWHHRGQSTTGNKIYEVWARPK